LYFVEEKLRNFFVKIKRENADISNVKYSKIYIAANPRISEYRLSAMSNTVSKKSAKASFDEERT